MEKSILEKIKENPARSASQVFYTILLVIVTVLVFLTSVGRPLLNAIYIIVLVIIAVLNFSNIAFTWWIYLLAGIIGSAVINLLSMALSGVLAVAQDNLLVKAFGYAADENEGGAVPASCAKPFDPTEKALNELEMKFEQNAVTEEEYLKRKKEILENGGNT